MACLSPRSERLEDVYQQDLEPVRRRRLSKPLTNSSNTSYVSLVNQHQGKKQSLSKLVPDPSPLLSTAESREALRSHLFTSTQDLELGTLPAKRSCVALMTLNFENKNAQTSTPHLLLASPTIPQPSMWWVPGTKGTLLSHEPSVSSLGSRDHFGNGDLGTVSPASSSEYIVHDPAPPARRVASFTPGIATRKPIMPIQETVKEAESAVFEAEAVTMRKYVRKIPQLAIEDDKNIESQPSRCATPSDLECGHLGRLYPGTLHVVNGRTSPTPDEVSKLNNQLWHTVEKRETSSIYPASEIGTIKSTRTVQSDWEDEPLPPLMRDTEANCNVDAQRIFSFNPGSEDKFIHKRTPSTPRKELSRPTEFDKTEDRTKTMADEYMAGLPTSPFASPSPPDLPRFTDIYENTFPQLSVAEDGVATMSSPTPQHDINSSPASIGSVRRYEDKANSRRSFIDETLGSSFGPDESETRATHTQLERSETPASFFSMPDSTNETEGTFKSAVSLLQPVQSRSQSPPKSPQKSLLQEMYVPAKLIPQRNNTKSDSGYSSNTSLSTVTPVADLQNVEGHKSSGAREEKLGLKLPFRKTVPKMVKSVPVQTGLSHVAATPSSAKIEIASASTSKTSLQDRMETPSRVSTSSLPPSTLKPKEKERKKLQKQRRKSTIELPDKIMAHNLQSIDVVNLPAISNTARKSLATRSETLPELDRTYQTQDHTAQDSNTPALILSSGASTEIRFPSPAPSGENDDRSRRSNLRPRPRKRSLSRPRTWFGRSRDDKDEPKKKAAEGSESAIVNDIGSIADLLGANPYDMARDSQRNSMPPSAWGTRPTSFQSKMSPSSITSNAPRSKPSMDDQTASMLSKLRRSSKADQLPQPVSRQSFDDRGGIPGKLPNCARTSMDAPPLPPMPTPQEINRRLSYRNGYATHPSPFPYEERWSSDPASINGDVEDAPPPPLHSPRPSYVDVDVPAYENSTLSGRHSSRSPSPTPFVEENPIYDHLIEEDEAPPPPCHSPRPVDVTNREDRSRNVSWSSQADVWRERRRSASAALHRSWSQVEEHIHPPPQTTPRRDQPGQSASLRSSIHAQTQASRHMQYQQWRSGEFPGQDYFNHTQGQHKQMYTGDDNRGRRRYEALDNGHWHQNFDEFSQTRPDVYSMYSETSTINDGYPDILYQSRVVRERNQYRLPSQHSIVSHRSRLSQGLQYDHQAQTSHRPLPAPRSQTYDDYSYRPQSYQEPQSNENSFSHSVRPTSRPTSRHSHASYRSYRSLAEELHPELDSSPPPNNVSRDHSPHIGRYSGGLEYNYDKYSRGFDGSAGTRSASTAKGNNVKTDGKKRSSWLDMEAYGIDFGDVPAMRVPIGATGDRMVYR